MRKLILSFVFVTAVLTNSAARTAGTDSIHWQDWSDRLFSQAQKENKFVILDLEAVWCHWCHVMDETTYQDPRVVELLASKFISVRVDQDANPALSLRYEDYGWPATIVFAPDGTEIVKRRGYLSPAAMISMLEAIIEDPTPGPSVVADEPVRATGKGALSDEQRDHLRTNYFGVYDAENGGWGTVHKFIHTESMEYALSNARQDARQATMAKQTLDAALVLIDPVWGGVYQYSDERDWKSPHYEKIMSFQAQYIRLYAEGYKYFGDPAYLDAARAIDRYLRDFLTDPSGAFYVSQDADPSRALSGKIFYAMDDRGRRKNTQPRIDKNRYARENGWAITALAALYDVTGDKQVLERALRAARWTIQHRRLDGGGFRHGHKDRAPPVLADTLAMGQAFLALHVSTGEREWLSRAEQALSFMAASFRSADGGYVTVPVDTQAIGVFKTPVRQVEENIALARFANSLFHYTGNTHYREPAEHAMRYLVTPQITDSRRFLAGVLLADDQLANDPTHVTVVGRKHDSAAQALYRAALRYPASYRRIEWWDRREGAMPNPDVQYPELPKAAAFICTDKTCSLPIFEPEKIAATLERLNNFKP